MLERPAPRGDLRARSRAAPRRPLCGNTCAKETVNDEEALHGAPLSSTLRRTAGITQAQGKERRRRVEERGPQRGHPMRRVAKATPETWMLVQFRALSTCLSGGCSNDPRSVGGPWAEHRPPAKHTWPLSRYATKPTVFGRCVCGHDPGSPAAATSAPATSAPPTWRRPRRRRRRRAAGRRNARAAGGAARTSGDGGGRGRHERCARPTHDISPRCDSAAARGARLPSSAGRQPSHLPVCARGQRSSAA